MEMGSAGFEPAKALPSDLQSDPFDRSGNSPSHVFIKIILRVFLRRLKKFTRPVVLLFKIVCLPFKFRSTSPDFWPVRSAGNASVRNADTRTTLFFTIVLNCAKRFSIRLRRELAAGLEPATCWLQISRSANWATLAGLLDREPNKFTDSLATCKTKVVRHNQQRRAGKPYEIVYS